LIFVEGGEGEGGEGGRSHTVSSIKSIIAIKPICIIHFNIFINLAYLVNFVIFVILIKSQESGKEEEEGLLLVVAEGEETDGCDGKKMKFTFFFSITRRAVLC
jgi:hypothetical protein